ncbi:hypothetical protein RhiirB3_454769 [Rhizophagus irregularis]|nr:hypothetical protein RhiirB3_454769 [Rhizophagus irregularis]
MKADILPKIDENEIIIIGRCSSIDDKFNPENPFNAKEFVQYDNDKITTEMLSNEEILKAVLPNNQEKEIEESLDPLPLITHSKAIEYYVLYLE